MIMHKGTVKYYHRGHDARRRSPALTGKWGGRFFGNGADPADHPGSVAGTFGAKSDDDLQAIIGAFGAYKQ